MGINTHILLPVEARIEDVAQVMGILAGLKPERHQLSSAEHSWSCEVAGAKVMPSANQFGCGNITIQAPTGKLIDGENSHSCFVIACVGTGMYKDHNTRHGHWISTAVSPFWEAIAWGLVRFFGGEVDRNDCDDIDVDFAMPMQPDITACDGEAWAEFQMRKMNVKPLKLTKQRAA